MYVFWGDAWFFAVTFGVCIGNIRFPDSKKGVSVGFRFGLRGILA